MIDIIAFGKRAGKVCSEWCRPEWRAAVLRGERHERQGLHVRVKGTKERGVRTKFSSHFR